MRAFWHLMLLAIFGRYISLVMAQQSPVLASSSVMSFWEKQQWFADADVLVAGGGLLGLWTAIELKKLQPGLEIVVVEQHAVPMGASTRNAGFACFGSASEVLSDIALAGLEKTKALIDQRWQGIQKIAGCFSADAIDLKWCGGYECLSEAGANDTVNQLEFLNRLLAETIGSEAVYREVEHPVASFGLKHFGAIIQNPYEGVLHSGKYVRCLMQKARDMGVRLLHGARIQTVESNEHGALVISKRGSWRCRSVVHTTNAALAKDFPQMGFRPGRGQMMLVNMDKPCETAGAWHASSGFYYWRSLHGKLLIGGGRQTDFEGEETFSLDNTAAILQHLSQYIGEHFAGKIVSIEHAWAGTMAFTPDKQPVCCEIAKNQWIAMCCNGMGVALSPVFAEIVAAKIVATLNLA